MKRGVAKNANKSSNLLLSAIKLDSIIASSLYLRSVYLRLILYCGVVGKACEIHADGIARGPASNSTKTE